MAGYTDPAGFSIELPPDWSAVTDASNGRIKLEQAEEIRAIIWPTWVNCPLSLTDAGRVLGILLKKLGGKAHWTTPFPVVEGIVGTQGNSGERAFLAWTSTPSGSSAVCYYLPKGAGETPSEQRRLAEILESFRLTGNPGMKTPPSPSTRSAGQRWTDPQEGAFSVEIPTGWTAVGGTTRPSSLLTQAKVELTSPDQQVYAYLGDAFPWFIEPNQFLGPGQTYRDPMGGSSPVWYYLPGGAFLTQYLLPQRWGQFQLEEERARPEFVEQLTRLAMGMNRFDAGEVRYSFTRNGTPCEGAAVCITQAFQSGSFATWQVYRLALTEAPQGRLAEGEAAIGQMVAGFQFNPTWLQGEAMKAGANSKTLAEMAAAVSNSVSSAFQYQQRTYDTAFAADADARRGIERLADPLSGQNYEVSSGSRFYWVDPQGTVVGTETDSVPHIDFRRLLGVSK